MNAKQSAASIVDKLDDNASWVDVKDALMKVYKQETGDARADAVCAVVLILLFVTASVFWISSQ